MTAPPGMSPAPEMMGSSFQPGMAAIPATKIEITVSCRKLRDRDTFSKSDPLCVLYMKGVGSERFVQVARTECIKDTLNPDFVKKFVVDYYFEELQKLLFEIYDVDSPSQKLERHDFLGRCECTLGEIVGSPSSNITRKLHDSGQDCGTITVSAEEMSSCKDVATLQFRAEKLDKKDFFGKSDPFLVFYRANEDNSWTICHKTEVVMNTLNPVWKMFTIPVRALCNSDYDRAIRVECYDWNKSGSHEIIGEFQCTMKELASGNFTKYECVDVAKKRKKKSYKHSGFVCLMNCVVEVQPSFLDYVRGGSTQINFTVAIDFTASNGNPMDSRSLHYMHSAAPNQYAQAIRSVGDVVRDYDSDKLFPVLGFGAKVPPSGKVSHEFFVNLHPDNPYVQEIDGILQAYHTCLPQVQLYGPTNFAPVINHVARFASAVRDGSQYFILLIITDGVITDMPQTKHAIVQSSSLPLSIIIVGVGSADFEAMVELDADNEPLSSHGMYATRDIVQFVPLRDFQHGSHVAAVQARLAKEVLFEIPQQFLGWMKQNHVKPQPPVLPENVMPDLPSPT